jgi:hypothetical protein
MRFSAFSSQLITLCYRNINCLVGINLNIAANMREYLKLRDFWLTLYLEKYKENIGQGTESIIVYWNIFRYDG